MATKFELAPDIWSMVYDIVRVLNMKNVDVSRVICIRSKGSKTRAIARCWEFPKIWQLALDKPAHYIIEIISHKFDKLNQEEKEKIIIHELLHITRNFSGHLRPHDHRLSKTIDKKINHLHKIYKKNI